MGNSQILSTACGNEVVLSANQQWLVFDCYSINRSAIKMFYTIGCSDKPEMCCLVIHTKSSISVQDRVNVISGRIFHGDGIMRSAPMSREYIQQIIDRLRGGTLNVKKD